MLPTLLKWICSLLLLVSALLAQGTPANLAQQLSFAGLRSSGGKGQFLAVASDAIQSIFLLYDQGDGIRLMKVSPDATKLLAAATLGQAGDVGSAMVLDPAGNVYITGTSSSGQLHATAGAAFSDPTAGTSGSFVARFDANLNPAWVSFGGGSRISASAIAANSNAVFITGITYGNDLPVSDSAILQQPAYGSVQNGFVEKFSADGTSLLYATYISGASGDTTPTGIAVDPEDDAWLVGSTTAPGFPTLSALVPEALSNPSGFLMELTPAADGITFSTFVPGNGLTSVALDAASQTLVASGNVALGQFPLDTVESPLVPAAYQSVLRFALDGSAVLNGAVIAPGTRSAVTVASGGSAWIAGDFDPSFPPLLPQSAIAGIGSSFAVRTNATGAFDQTVRLGGLPIEDQTFAGIPTSLNALAVQGGGSLLAAGAVQPTASSSLLGVERYDLPLNNAASAVLGSSIADAEAAPASCGGSLCSGSAALLAIVQTASSGAGPVLSLDELPFGTLRNLGSSDIEGLRLTSSAGSIATNCPSTLAAAAECSLLLTGGGSGVMTVSSTNAAQLIVPFPSYRAPDSGAVVFSPREIDFGIVAAASGPVAKTFTLTNLGTATETIAEGPATSGSVQTPYFEQQSDCALAGSGIAKMLGPGAVCHITIGLSASSDAANDGSQRAAWIFGSRQALLTGYTQAASLGLSASEIDFGVDLEGGLTPPRYLYLSNSSNQPLAHAPVSLPGDSSFQVTDTCPSVLGAGSVCRIRLDYASASAPSTDSASLQLDQGRSVVLTGTTKPQPADGGSSANPNLALTPSAVSFATSVPVTGVSTETQTVAISNSGGLPFRVSLAVVGDFTYTTSCNGDLGPGESCAVALAFAPSQPGPRQGLLLVSASGGAGSISVPLSAIAKPILSANNGLLDFGSVPVSQPTFQFLKVLSPFSQLTVTVSPPFRVALIEDNGSSPGALPDTAYVAGGTGTCRNCWIALLFDPRTSGAQSGSLSISSAARGSPYLLSLSGFGIASAGMVLSPAVASFGSVPVLSASGTMRLNVSNLTNPGVAVSLSPPGMTGDFVIDSTDRSANTCGGTLDPGASCILSVRFLPSATGLSEGTLTVPTSAGKVTGTLNGNGASQNSIAIEPLALDFESDQGASASVKQVRITNTGAIAAAVGPPSTTSSNFEAAATCGELDPGASCTVAVTFTASAQLAHDTLSIPVTTLGSDHQAVTAHYAVALSGSYTAGSAGLTLFPSTLDFGSEATQTLSATRVINVNNVSTSTLTLALQAPRNFTVAGTTCTTLKPGASCSIDLAFLPMTSGALSGSLAVTTTDQAGSPGPAGIVYAQGFGVGTGSLTVSGGLIVTGTYSFGSIAPGQSVTNTFTVANLSSPTVPIWVRRVTSRPPFLSSTNCSAPLNLGETCSIRVTYAPISPGSSAPDAGLLSIESDAQSGPDTIALKGQAASSLSAANATSLASYTISQGSLSFPSVEVGATSPVQIVTLTNTGNLEINFTSVSASADFLIRCGCQLLPPGSQCTVFVMSFPHLPGAHFAALEIASNASSSLDFVSLASTAGPAPLSLRPTVLDFGTVQVGSFQILPVQATNSSSSPISLSSITTTGDFSSSGDCPIGGSLAPGDSCTTHVRFTPSAIGHSKASLGFVTSATTLPLTVALTGIGSSSKAVLTPSSLAFGSIVVGASADRALTLTNTGSSPLNAISTSVSWDFKVTAPCATSLAPGQSCVLEVRFSPTQAGWRNSSLIVASSDTSSPTVVPLTGTGLASASFTLTVAGGAAASATISSGLSTSFALQVTPQNGYGGSVALTCTPVQQVSNATCSLLPSLVSLGAEAQTTSATISTASPSFAGLQSDSNKSGPGRPLLALCALLSLLRWGRPSRPFWPDFRLERSGCAGYKKARVAFSAIRAMLWLPMLLCGCSRSAAPPAAATYDTPPGTYLFQVTASSTSGVQISQTVTLTVIVTPSL